MNKAGSSTPSKTTEPTLALDQIGIFICVFFVVNSDTVSRQIVRLKLCDIHILNLIMALYIFELAWSELLG